MSPPTAAKKPAVTEIDSWLPQTQCTKCGYPRCLDYARAIAEEQAEINLCPPGGDITIRGLAALTGQIGKPLDPGVGPHKQRGVAVIDEEICIGCVMCIRACPVDAIAGAKKLMHTVIAEDCTGCELCIEPCPVDCISMRDVALVGQTDGRRWPDYSPAETGAARRAAEARIKRLSRREIEKESGKRLRRLRRSQGSEHIREEILAAVARQRARRSTGSAKE